LIFPGNEENQALLGKSGPLQRTLLLLQQHMRTSQLLPANSAQTLKLDPSWMAGS
jgi:hypothetical protein